MSDQDTLGPSFFDREIERGLVPALKVHPMVLGEKPDGLFAAGVADMDFRVAPAIVAAMRLRTEHEIFGYETVPDGLLPALTDWLAKRHGWSVSAAEILRAPNVLNALATSVTLFTEPGDGVIVQPPVFFDFFDILRENGREARLNPLRFEGGRYTMDLDDLEAKAAEPRTRVLLLCNPHNPVGRVWTEEELRAVSEICARHDVLVVSDEIHGDIVYPEHRYSPFASLGADQAHRSITCLSPAKTFNIAACCCAFTVIPDGEKRRAFHAANSRFTVNKNNAFANVAMEAAYRHGEPWLESALAYLWSNIALVRERVQTMTDVDLVEPEGTFLLWLDFRRLNLTPDDLNGFLRQRAGWAVSRGQAFGRQGEGFSRVNIACTRTRLASAMDGLKQALQDR
jgi:cystathionine beta-lyase